MTILTYWVFTVQEFSYFCHLSLASIGLLLTVHKISRIVSTHCVENLKDLLQRYIGYSGLANNIIFILLTFLDLLHHAECDA